MDMITYSFPNFSKSLLVKEAPGINLVSLEQQLSWPVTDLIVIQWCHIAT